jgi:16S rRNA (guanine527-N7)-methyltransferase
MMASMREETAPFRDALIHAVAPWGMAFEPEQITALEFHYRAMVTANDVMNLTRITGPVEAAIKHYADSLALLPWATQAGLSKASLLDVGTGAGFPAVPIAVMRPEWRVTALDGTRKKAEFVSRVAADLGLKNLETEHGHSDHWVSAEKFDIATTRAVASLARCMRTAHRFIRKGGRLIAYKIATLSNDELIEARQACKELSMELEPPFFYELEWNSEKLARALYPVRLTM